MIGKRPNAYFRICWKYITPAVGTVRQSLKPKLTNGYYRTLFAFDSNPQENYVYLFAQVNVRIDSESVLKSNN